MTIYKSQNFIKTGGTAIDFVSLIIEHNLQFKTVPKTREGLSCYVKNTEYRVTKIKPLWI